MAVEKPDRCVVLLLEGRWGEATEADCVDVTDSSREGETDGVGFCVGDPVSDGDGLLVPDELAVPVELADDVTVGGAVWVVDWDGVSVGDGDDDGVAACVAD